MRAALAAFAFLAAVVPVNAATFTAERTVDGAPAIRMSGLLADGDELTFQRMLAAKPTPTTLITEGWGGDALAAIKIGMEARGMRTVVPTGQTCASACAFVWLAGKTRVREAPSDVGFHAVYVTKGTTKAVSAPGNAVVGAYLDQIGISPPAIVYMMSAGPDLVQWLFPEDRQRYGLAYEDAAPASIAVLAGPPVHPAVTASRALRPGATAAPTE